MNEQQQKKIGDADRPLVPTVGLDELPSPPPDKAGWPWTETTASTPQHMPNGRAWPRISIVTPSYNQGAFLEETIRSILLQGYPNLEYIIIDGGSSDESVAILEKYSAWLSYWVSEPDNGQSHAINKGLSMATGSIFNWVNSDDFLLPDVLVQVAAVFDEHDAVAGNIIYFEQRKEYLGSNAALEPTRIISDGGLSFQQPGIWLRRNQVSCCGGIDEQLHYAFDWDLAIRYFSLFPDVKYLSSALVRFRLHEDSKTVGHQERFSKEMTLILRNLLKMQQFASLHQTCKRIIQRRELYSLITSVRVNNPKRPLYHLMRLSLRNPRVLLLRFFWGAVRESITGASMDRNPHTAWRSLSSPLRTLLRPITRWYRQRPHPMSGVLEGCRMGGYKGAYHEGKYEPAVSAIMVRIVQPGWICVDVGANVGYFALLLAKLVGESGKVIAFEAHPTNAAKAQANIRVNSFQSRVTIENIAVSDKDGESVNLFPGRECRGEEWNIVGHDVSGNPTRAEMQVPTTSLDNYFSSSCIDFVKMDIEGAEVQALSGMRRLLRDCRPIVLVEFHGEEGWASRAELFTMKYCLYDVESRHWLKDDPDMLPVYQCLAVPEEKMCSLNLF